MAAATSGCSPRVILALFYFLSYGALGALFPYLPLLLAERRLTSDQIAWVMVLSPLLGVLMPPLWGSAADVFRVRNPLLRLSAVGTGLAVLLLLHPWGFWGSLASVGALSLFRAPLASLADAATVAAMETEHRGYGRIRVWGSVGFALFAGLLGLGQGSLSPRLLVGLTSFVYLLSALVTLPLPSPVCRRERGVIRDTWDHVRHPGMSLFLVGNTAYYFGHAIYDVFIGLHLRALGLSDTFVGAAWAIGVMSEVGMMILLPAFLSGSSRRSALLLCFATLLAGLRWWLLAQLAWPPAILGSQILHAGTFGLWYLSVVEYVQSNAAERLRTSLQSVVTAMIGVGSSAGCLVGGQVFRLFGSRAVFRLASWGSVAALLSYGLAVLASPFVSSVAEEKPPPG